MGFSTKPQQAEFLRDAPDFERMLVESGITLAKYWLDISKDEQAARLEARRKDPLKALKISALDAVAQEKWSDYSAARDTMLERTSTALAPWVCVKADHKMALRLNLIRHLLRQVGPGKVAKGVEAPDPDVLFPFEAAALEDGRLAK